MTHKRHGLGLVLERFSMKVTHWTGSSSAFAIACAIVLLWLLSGPIFGFSDTWQLVINTGTTIVTFLMVFLIQRTQNKDSMAIQLKLNELVAAMEGASNRLIDVEELAEDELVALHKSLRALGGDGAQRREAHGVTFDRGSRAASRAEAWQAQEVNHPRSACRNVAAARATSSVHSCAPSTITGVTSAFRARSAAMLSSNIVCG